MRLITLTTDLGYRDPYLALVKAKFLSSELQPQILDLSTGIRSSNISEAAFVLGSALSSFPENTIHLVAVKLLADQSSNSRADTADNSRFLLTRYKNQYILSPDNGLFTLLDSQFNADVYQVFYEGETVQHFFLRDIFAEVALQLLAGKQLQELGSLTRDYFRAFQFESYVTGNMLRGKGIYVDDFGNIITNITKIKFAEIIGKRSFTITLPGTRLTRISNTYDDVKYGAALVLFNSFGYLEVAVNGRSAYQMLCPRDIGSSFDFNLMIEFND